MRDVRQYVRETFPLEEYQKWVCMELIPDLESQISELTKRIHRLESKTIAIHGFTNDKVSLEGAIFELLARIEKLELKGQCIPVASSTSK